MQVSEIRIYIVFKDYNLEKMLVRLGWNSPGSINCYDLLTPVTTSPKYTEIDNSRRIKYFTKRTKYQQ